MYQQEPLEVGYEILCVVADAQSALLFKRAGATVSILMLSDMVVLLEALATQSIPPEKLCTGGMMPLTTLDQPGSNFIATKRRKDLDILFSGC